MLARKVPEITVLFWVIKLLTTAAGEAFSDFLVGTIDPVIAVGLGALGLVGALILQFTVKQYTPWRYWLTALMVAIFGTMVADVIHVALGVPYLVSTIGFAVILAAVFIIWKCVEGTLSIHSVRSYRQEIFYWLAVMATFALGTAVGDMTASTLNLGYVISALLFVALILIPAIIWFLTNKMEVLWFWTAYVVTRPLGASFADWFGKAPSAGGLGFGDGVVAMVLFAAIVAAVFLATYNPRERHREQR